VIDNGGKPFEIYPGQHSDLDWGCGGRHKRGCPAERLAASSLQGRVRWFDASTESGFIIPDCGGADLRFHRTSLVPGSAGRLPRKGDPVAYEVERTRFEPRTVRVRSATGTFNSSLIGIISDIQPGPLVQELRPDLERLGRSAKAF
jgi:cold shock CspA family protein